MHINIIDIRSSYKYNDGHIPNAINIPEGSLLSNPSIFLNKNTTYQIYCDYGNRSRMVVNYLNSMGYKCVNIDGGYNNYLLEK